MPLSFHFISFHSIHSEHTMFWSLSNEELGLCCPSAFSGEGGIEFASEEDTAFWSLPNAEFGLSCSSVTSGEEGLVFS
jgi:hypothetical protein